MFNTKVIYDNNKNLLAALEPHHEAGLLGVVVTEFQLGDLQVAAVDEADNLINNNNNHSKYY